ncbi:MULTISPECIES: phage tail tape measure protein [unclassified Saccharibacter]|uniref:phage tail tape measure protein n=1 Tax=unclassified Saccharibacter TaxID=2648722 RepID=UPI00132929DE|nr:MULTISPECIES: phage tail tape measure protein [unclassified Saccharibacter]MXV35844.1 phage tail tape measure protein [Saccharibacter sp. EH611]MXV57965.1 phage tail tape measure protein [Saccharibacter sp. EH70]MXV66360.1 phage tail tape measure protein [Saccharibacter sp. EH60]
MAGDLNAQFELSLLDKISAPLREVLDRLEGLNSVLSRFEGQGNEATGATDALHRALSEASGGADGAAEAMGKAGLSLGEMGGSSIEAARTSAALNDVLTQVGTGANAASEAVGRVAEAMDTAGQHGAEAAEGMTPFVQEMDQVEQSAERSLGVLRRLRSAMSGMGEVQGGFKGAMHGFHDKWGQAQMRGFGALMSGFELVEPVKQAAEYDNTIRHVGIGLEIHGGALDQYVADEKVKINQLARSTGQRSGDLAEALGFFSREGFRGQELENSLATTAKIATAYNAHPEAVAKSAFALKENLGIDDAHLQGALASVAIAGKQADLPFEKLAPLLPQVAASAGALGIHGRAGVNDLAAALAVVRKSTGTEGEAATDARAFLQTITSSHGAKKWREIFGEDLFKLEDTARKHGQDPMMVVMERIRSLVQHLHGDRNKAFSMIFHNLEDKGFANGVLDHWKQYQDIHQKVSGATQGVIDHDYADGRKSGLIAVQEFEDATTQLMRRIGDDFTPTLRLVTAGITEVNVGLEKMDAVMPGVSKYLIGGVGAFIGVITVMSAVGAVASAVSAGFGVVMAIGGAIAPVFGVLGAAIGAVGWPVIGVVALIAGLAVAIYEMWAHWGTVKAWLISAGHTVGHAISQIGAPLGLILGPIGAVGVALYEMWKHWDTVKRVLDQTGIAIVQFINHIIDILPGTLSKGLHALMSGPDHPAPNPALLGPDGRYKPLVSPDEQWKRNWKAQPPTLVRPVPPPLPALGQQGRAKDSHIHLHVTADEGLKAHAHSQRGMPLNVHVHGSPNSMMGRP